MEDLTGLSDEMGMRASWVVELGQRRASFVPPSSPANGWVPLEAGMSLSPIMVRLSRVCTNVVELSGTRCGYNLS